MSALEVIILSGFLGSGKTTLLVSHLTDMVTTDTAVIVNEVGQIDIDGAVVAASATVPSVMLSNGCVCCSMGSDLLDTFERLQNDRLMGGNAPFRRVIIECSGLSKPGPIVRLLRRLPVRHLDVRIVTAFHVAQGERQLAEHEEVAAQLAAAHAIVLTHANTSTTADRHAAAALVQCVNPLAALVDEIEPTLNARCAFSVALSTEMRNLMMPTEENPMRLRLGHRSVKTFLISLSPELDWEQISVWLDDVASFCGDRLLRLKGFIQPKDSHVPVLVQSVGTVFSTPRQIHLAASGQLGLVLITRGVSSIDLEEFGSDMIVGIRTWEASRSLVAH